jgi:hypothetical protein
MLYPFSCCFLIQALSSDTETRVLNEMDDEIQNVIEFALERPSLSNSWIIPNETHQNQENIVLYYILSVCSQTFGMRRRNMLKESEWKSQVQLMENSFQRGTISGIWIRIEKDRGGLILHFRNS